MAPGGGGRPSLADRAGKICHCPQLHPPARTHPLKFFQLLRIFLTDWKYFVSYFQMKQIFSLTIVRHDDEFAASNLEVPTDRFELLAVQVMLDGLLRQIIDLREAQIPDA
jgi:hypothetical protein